MRPRRTERGREHPIRATTVLIVSASMGAGHDGAARELQGRLERRGDTVVVVDLLDLFPIRFGRVLRASYRFQLRFAPWSYELAYRLLATPVRVLWSPIVALTSTTIRGRLGAVLRRTQPDVVVSTYPLASMALGRMRAKRWLRVPVMTYLTDFAVHPLWIHPGVDRHVAVSPASSSMASERDARDTRTGAPLVRDDFRSGMPSRVAARARLQVDADAVAVLVVAGSWGIGDVRETVAAIERCGAYQPIVVCGRDDALRARLTRASATATVLGWTDDMPGCMAAADVLVENAGGLSAMEAFAAGLPVVTYRPIAGHGRDNAETMAASGVTLFARDEDELARDLVVAATPGPERDRLIGAARALFGSDPADDVEDLAVSVRLAPDERRVQIPMVRRRVAAVVVAGLVSVYGLLTLGAQGASAVGVGVAKPPAHAPRAVYLSVRVGPATLRNGAARAAIRQSRATVVADTATATSSSAQLAVLRAAGIDIANGGAPGRYLFRWERGEADCRDGAETLTRTTGAPPIEFVAAHPIDGFDQMYCRTGRMKQRLVRANHTFTPTSVPGLRNRGVYVLDARAAPPGAIARALHRVAVKARRSGLRVRSYRALR
jgi:UDP-N-acetylglucosamine:LPS N-acetylglucosamine transferase